PARPLPARAVPAADRRPEWRGGVVAGGRALPAELRSGPSRPGPAAPRGGGARRGGRAPARGGGPPPRRPRGGAAAPAGRALSGVAAMEADDPPGTAKLAETCTAADAPLRYDGPEQPDELSAVTLVWARARSQPYGKPAGSLAAQAHGG